MTFNIEKYKEEIDQMNVNVLNGKPALKKPLLLLLIISKFEESYFLENKINFIDVEEELKELIQNYGGRPSKNGPKAHHPFQYMNSSFFWNLKVPQGTTMTNSHELPMRILRNQETYVTLDEDLFQSLKGSRQVRAILSNFILQKWWPETVQEELRNILNLPIESYIKPQIGRDKEFTSLVLANFRYKCAFCGFSSSFNRSTFGLDGAHIKWFSQKGPDIIDNGLSLCKLHHWAFDRGALSVHPKTLTILVSNKFVGQEENSIQLIEGLNGKLLYPYKEKRPNQKFLEWHNDFIFVG